MPYRLVPDGAPVDFGRKNALLTADARPPNGLQVPKKRTGAEVRNEPLRRQDLRIADVEQSEASVALGYLARQELGLEDELGLEFGDAPRSGVAHGQQSSWDIRWDSGA